MLNNTKKVILKILSIYLISTLFFLLSIFFIVITWKENEIYDKSQQSIREYKRFLINLINTHDAKELKTLTSKDNIQSCVFIKNKKIYCNFDLKSIKLPNKRGFFYDKEWIYYYTNLDKSLKNVQIILKGTNNLNQLNKYKKKLFFLIFIILIFSSFIAYILIKILIKPLEENIKVMDNFLKETTHEIKAPLSIINMSIETMQTNMLTDKNNKRVNNIKTATNSLNSIYEDLTDIHFNSKHKIELVEFDKLLEQRITFFTPLLENNSLTLIKSISESKISIDKTKLIKIIDNLISNAIKHSKNNSTIKIELRDNYFKIINHTNNKLPLNLEQLFERYYKINNSSDGFGIGLNLVKKLCNDFNICIKATRLDKYEISFLLNWYK